MPERLADRLHDAAATACVGRDAERRQLLDLVRGDRVAVVFVHGPAGIGKSELLASALRHGELRAVHIDGRDVEPTPAGLLGPVGVDLDGVTAAFADVDVLAIDSYERLGMIDGWLRNEFLPRLPAHVRTVFACRHPPNVAWRTSPGWRRLVGEVVIGPMSEPDSRQLLSGHRLPPSVAERALRFGRGHPLALELAAEAFRRRPTAELHDGPPPEVVEELVEVIYDGLTAEERRIAEAVSVLRRVTEPLLAAVVGTGGGARPDVVAAWRVVRDLPFTTVTPHGLELNAVVQDVTASALELRNPRLARDLRRRAARVALAEVERAPGWGPTADLLHLVQIPVVRNGFVPPSGFQHPVEQAAAADLDAILAIVDRHDGPDGVAVITAWWVAHPDGFVVARGVDGGVTAFSVVVELARLDRGLAAADPVTALVLDHVAAHRLPSGARVLFNRHALSQRGGADGTAELAPMFIDIKRTYLELRPDLARVYVASSGLPGVAAMMRGLGFRDAGPPVSLGRSVITPNVLDFGPGSVDGWLARLVDSEPDPVEPTGRTSTAATSAARSAEVIERVGRLSPREREVLAALAEGLSNHELAERLFISERTANRHLSNIFVKLGVRNRTAAARIAIEGGITS